MRFPSYFAHRITLLAVVAVVVGCPFAISVPWLAVYRWFAGPVVENPGFLTAPVDNQSWFVVFASACTGLVALAFWRPDAFRSPRRADAVVIAGAAWFIITLGRAAAAPHFLSMHLELLLQGAYLILFLAAAAHRVTARELIMFLLTLAVMVLPLSLLALMQNAGVDPLPYSPVVAGSLDVVSGKNLIASTFGHPNFMGSYLAPAALLSVGLAFSRVQWQWRIVAGLSAGASLMAMVAGGTRGPLLAMAAGVVVFVLMGGLGQMSRRQVWLVIAGALSCVALAVGLALTGLTYDIADRLFAGKEVASRVFYWVVGLEMFKGSPILGVGAGQFDSQFWWAVSRIPETEPGGPWHFVVESIIRGVSPGYMHNDHLQVLVESGLVGAASWAVLWAMIGRRAVARMENLKAMGTSGMVSLNAGFAAAFAVVCVDALTGFPFHLPCSGALFWGALGLWSGLRPTEAIPAEE